MATDDYSTPPETPPGDPSLEPPETSESGEASADAPKSGTARAPVFSKAQIGELGSAIGQGLRDALIPKSVDTADPTAVTPPVGPSPADLQAQINQLDQQIDLAVTEGKPIAALISQRDGLRDQKFDAERVQPLRAQGASALNKWNLAEVRRNDPFFQKYEKEIMGLLKPSMQQGFVLNEEVLREAMALVKGRHIEEILAEETEARIRGEKLGYAAPMPGSRSGRDRSVQPATPQTIESRFGANAVAAMETKRHKGIDEDSFARRMGFKNKQDWFQQDDVLARQIGVGLDSYWDAKNKRWIGPDELNEFYNR